MEAPYVYLNRALKGPLALSTFITEGAVFCGDFRPPV